MSLAPILSPLFSSYPEIKHGFFTRQGGHSTGVYASLNCGQGSHDDPSLVKKNRLEISRFFGVSQDCLLTLFQCHSNSVVVVEAPWPEGARPLKADALVTKKPGLVLGVLTADCAPLLLYDHKAQVIAAIHAGRKGAFLGIIQETIATMEQQGAKRETLLAALGPTISQKAYAVGEECVEEGKAHDPKSAPFFLKKEKEWFFDLPNYVAFQLRNEGIAKISESGLCTYTHPDLFFSFRRTTHNQEPDYGRGISALMLEPSRIMC